MTHPVTTAQLATAPKAPAKRKTKAAPDFTPDAWALRTADKNGRAYGGFQWPTEVGAYVECPNWNAEPVCGNGLHGYLDGLGSRDQLSTDADALWYVVEVVRAECVLIDGDKSKFPRCRVKYVGSFGGALAMLPLKMVGGIFAQAKASKTAAATTGDGSAAATTGKNSIAAALGPNSTARADHKTGAIVLSEWDERWNLIAVAAFKVGDGGIEAGKTYRLVGGKPVEVQP